MPGIYGRRDVRGRTISGPGKFKLVTDELFDYFGKGSKKFEPLDDDLELPEVSTPLNDESSEDNPVLEESVEVEVECSDADDAVDSEECPIVSSPAELSGNSSADDDEFGGFGAGLFDDDIDDLDAAAAKAKSKPAVAPEPAVAAEPEPAPPESEPAPPEPEPNVPALAESEAARPKPKSKPETAKPTASKPQAWSLGSDRQCIGIGWQSRPGRRRSCRRG